MEAVVLPRMIEHPSQVQLRRQRMEGARERPF